MRDIKQKSVWLIAGLLWSGIYAEAKVSPVIHYNFGRVGNVTYAVAPDEIKSLKGNAVLKSVGQPVFYADAPGDKKMRGEGGILFNGKGEGYILESGYSQQADNNVWEIWVKSRELDTAGKLLPVLAGGDGKSGYVIGQKDKQWILAVDGKEAVALGEISRGAWTHLAVVIEGGWGTVWVNGKETGHFKPSNQPGNKLSIAVPSSAETTEENSFYGEVYEVRYSTFKPGEFDAESDFLLDYKKIKKQDKARAEKHRALLTQLKEPGLGKELVTEFAEVRQREDWLISKVEHPCRLQVKEGDETSEAMFRIDNGLVSRTFYVGENLACVGYKNLSNEAEYLRAVKPEARIRVDSVWYEVGGLKNQPEYSYLLESWYPELEASEQAFTLSSVETRQPSMRYPWKPKFHAVPADWPAKGLQVVMTYEPTESMVEVKDLTVKVYYEIYQGIPVMAKWIEVENHGEKPMTLNEVETEVLAVNQDQRERMHVESDYSFALVNADVRGSALMHYNGTPEKYHVGSSTTQWRVDEEYHTWASHNQAEDKFLGFLHHNLLVSTLPMGPDVEVSTQSPFRSYITFELLQDSDDRERKSLAHRRMYKTLAPQVTESLIAGGITSHDEVQLKKFIDQMAELGLEQLDIMAWPGISHDNLDSAYVRHWRNIASYARERGIVMGGYELQVASRGRGKEVDCVDPKTGKQGSLFGQSVCIASQWKDTYYPKMWEFFDRTGFMTYNMDGPYHGDVCASDKHPHHRGLADSQWEQWKTQVEVIHELQRRGMYIPIPDWYFLNGQNATGMGYREASANLTPQQQLLLGRQYIYDGTWHKLPPMGWMTLQLVGFYTNDARVGLEPLCENLSRYEQQLIQYLASGCKLTIRGNRLYDTPETKQMVQKWISWFKTYRDILTSEIIHVGRPTGRDLDCIMHVNPFIKHKGMVVVFNPTDKDRTKEWRLPLYYTGLKEKVTVIAENGTRQVCRLDENHNLILPVTVKAQGTVWFLLEE